MLPPRDSEYICSLVNELRCLPSETEWVEFKVNNDNPRDIGENISALANGAALTGKPFSYQVWGIEDSTHDIVGTGFSPALAKKGVSRWRTGYLGY